MVKRLLILGLLVLPALGWSDDDVGRTLLNGAGTGGIAVPGAEIRASRGALTAWGSYLNEGSLIEPGDSVTRKRYGVGAHYAPLDFLELGLSVSGADSSSNLARNDIGSFGDIVASAKGAYALTDDLSTGARVSVLLFSGVEQSSGYGDTASYAGEWVSTWRKGGLAAHLALGFLYDRTVNFVARRPTAFERFAWGQADFNQALYGLSLNYETALADYTVELSGEAAVGEGAPDLGESPMRVTPGFRLRPWGPLELQVAANLALAKPDSDAAGGLPAQPTYDILAAVRWNFDFSGDAQPVQEEAPVEDDESIAPAPAPEAVPVPEPTPAPEAATTPEAAARPGSIAGRVINMATGKPIGGAKVSVRGTQLSSQTSPSGNYVLAGVPAGEVTLDVEGAQMKPKSAAGSVKPGGFTNLDVGLEPAATTGTVAITLTDESGKPVADADVLVDGDKQGKTGADGRATIDDVAAGLHQFSAEKSGFKPGEPLFIEITPGETISETLTLEAKPRPGYVEIKVINDAREPIKATIVVEGHPDLTRELDPAAGSTATLKLDPGSYRIRVEAEGYRPETQAVDVETDGEYALRYKLGN